MSSQPSASPQSPQHGKDPWRLRRVQRAQPHLGEDDRRAIPLWAAGAGAVIVLALVSAFLFAWFGLGNRSRSAPSAQPLTSAGSATPADMPQPASTNTPVFFATPTDTPILVAPSPTAPVAHPTATVVKYRVRPGDTLTAIAARYGVSVRAIMAVNRLRRDIIYNGEELIIPLATPRP